ncbi:hypothetical protein DENSPDRAFT_820585 [Dentipellis sp. KUC8613]|nr:hypothetical protein DENSPDRAFT_820585 [Dentipellis sp. KUC8613]
MLQDRESCSPELRVIKTEVEVDTDLLTEHPVFYFSDGHVILKCSNILFRVNHSLLSIQSHKLRDMLHRKADSPTLRGALLVELDDDPADVEAFLAVLYHRLQFKFAEFNAATFPQVAGVLRLATKYEVESLRANIMTDVIGPIYPTLLNNYLSRQALQNAILQGGRMLVKEANPAMAITLLREVQCKDRLLLGTLFYDLSARLASLEGAPSVYLRNLSDADADRLIIGVARLRWTQAMCSHLPKLRINELQMQNPHHNASACYTIIDNFWTSCAIPILLRQPHTSWPVEAWNNVKVNMEHNLQQRICSHCYALLHSYVTTKELSLWNDLAGIFDLV